VLDRLASIASLVIAASALVAAAAVAAECPTLDGEERLKLLDQAPTCDKSMALFELCAYGASGDVGLGEAVIKKCEGDFLATLGASQRRQYDREQQRCAHKYQKESGSLYRSFEAFCAAGVAKTYAHRFSKGAKP
jgi:hypothetical protein